MSSFHMKDVFYFFFIYWVFHRKYGRRRGKNDLCYLFGYFCKKISTSYLLFYARPFPSLELSSCLLFASSSLFLIVSLSVWLSVLYVYLLPSSSFFRCFRKKLLIFLPFSSLNFLTEFVFRPNFYLILICT